MVINSYLSILQICTQMYTLGPNEFYIDVSIPYGRADSARVFSWWISLV